jgi:hypothetical protein
MYPTLNKKELIKIFGCTIRDYEYSKAISKHFFPSFNVEKRQRKFAQLRISKSRLELFKNFMVQESICQDAQATLKNRLRGTTKILTYSRKQTYFQYLRYVTSNSTEKPINQTYIMRYVELF